MVEGQEPKRKEEEEEKKKKPKGQKRKEVFIYGNYRSYYGYRIDRNLSEDPRLAVLKREWFEGKDCLDVGCNQGLITISIAKKFSCQSILGIDIDSGLIETAKWNLQNIARKEKTNCRPTKVSGSDVSNSSGHLPHMVLLEASNDETCKSLGGASPLQKSNPLARVSFRTENFVESFHGCYEKYDTILWYKWIHLNWGDDGLITLFVKIWKLLRPGGVLLLEPQPWSSYKRNRLVSETTKENFRRILLHPSFFREILLDKVGFSNLQRKVISNMNEYFVHMLQHQIRFGCSCCLSTELAEVPSTEILWRLSYDIEDFQVFHVQSIFRAWGPVLILVIMGGMECSVHGPQFQPSAKKVGQVLANRDSFM
ncbi:hypothetical protein J5N97_004425 [Dioscorea zingiberensis]|uniref:RNA methyltransferase n=1 Tax=Dioscorea zingiberensis TaxID=325984 RepID=A0A9D5D792_9LILI|nr:hypothetical protein J5N97_004425 [Dioscorea zingiberensis]